MNPRRYPTGSRYPSKRPPTPPKREGRLSIRMGGLIVVSLAVVARVVGAMLWPSSEGRPEQLPSRTTALDATRPSDVFMALPTATTRPEPTPNPSATPRPIPVRDPTLTEEEVDGTFRFAHRMLDLETEQHRINRDYRFYDIELMNRWVGESFVVAEAILARQEALLHELRSVEPSVEQELVVLALYEDSVREEVEAIPCPRRRAAPPGRRGRLGSGRDQNRHADPRGRVRGTVQGGYGAARGELELLVNRVGTTLESIENSRGPDSETF